MLIIQIIYPLWRKDLSLNCRSCKSPLAYTGGFDKSIPNAGKLIGVVERLLAFVLILAGQYTALGFIIAAKSILALALP